MKRFDDVRRLAAARGLLIGALLIGALLGAAAPAMHAQEGGRYGHYEVYDRDLLPRTEYARRRASVQSQLDSASAMLVRSADVRNRSNDVDYEYRQRNGLLYLSGVLESESALLLLPRPFRVDGDTTSQILFVSERNPSMETWTGLKMGPGMAAQVTGIRTVLPYGRLNEVLDSVLPSIARLYYDDWMYGSEREPLTGTSYAWDREMRKGLKAKLPCLDVRRASDILTPMRMIKSPAEISLMQRAADISIEGHRQTIRNARPGMHEYEFAAMMEYQFHRLGAEHPGYPSIVGSGPNTCILHYETNRRQSQAGDLVLMDCGAEYHGYTADITRTFPVSGTFTKEQRAIYDIVLEAQIAGIEACRAGNNFRIPHRKAIDVIVAGLKRLGIIKEDQEYSNYFMHGTSHYLGLDVHDVGSAGELAPGMVLTVEPGIYIAAGSDCDPKWWNIGIRIEDDILVTSGAPVNLSAALERTADDIEKLMRASQ
jgi:Xaa-Pro aminopeptidase